MKSADCVDVSHKMTSLWPEVSCSTVWMEEKLNRASAECSVHVCSASHLVANGLGATPLQKDLLDAAGAGHPEALRALQLGFGIHRQGPAVARESFTVRPGSAKTSHAP